MIVVVAGKSWLVVSSLNPAVPTVKVALASRRAWR